MYALMVQHAAQYRGRRARGRRKAMAAAGLREAAGDTTGLSDATVGIGSWMGEESALSLQMGWVLQHPSRYLVVTQSAMAPPFRITGFEQEY